MDQGQTLETGNLLAGMSDFIADDRPQRFFIGFLFAVAFFLIAAGISEILLARNEACVETLSGFRVPPNPEEVCMSELRIVSARGISRGVIGSLNPAMPVHLAWLLTGVLYGLIGGGLAQFSTRIAIAGFAFVIAIVLMISMVVAFISQFIVLG